MMAESRRWTKPHCQMDNARIAHVVKLYSLVSQIVQNKDHK
jgi:hypothetical protein